MQVESTDNRAAAAIRTISIIENRLNALGIVGSTVVGQPNGQILIKLPVVEQPDRLKSILTTRGTFEITRVISLPHPAPVQLFATREEAIASLNNGGTIPPNRRVLPYSERKGSAGAMSTKWVVVDSLPLIDGRELRNASAVPAPGGDEYQILFSLKQDAVAKLGPWSASHINEYLGVVLNDEVKSIPYIKSQLTDQGEINGHFSKQSAEDLVLILKSGALLAPVKIVSEKVEGNSGKK
ncbi:MAG: SecDF P1 head subdomain-containing protein [Pyrinomonadaceae bacterium]